MFDELFVFHGTVAVDFDTFEDFVNFILLEGLTEGSEDVLDFDGKDVSVTFLVEDFHTFKEVLFGTSGWEFTDVSEDWEEFIETDLFVGKI